MQTFAHMEPDDYPYPHLKEIYLDFTNWKNWDTVKPEGIITGCDWKMQTMIPWWWKHFSNYNSLPVTFIDMGLSDAMRRFCESKGTVVKLHIPKYLLKRRIPLSEKIHPKAEKRQKLERLSYFSKPFAMLKTPYQHTVWIDIDCQVQAPLSQLFDYCEGQIALTPMSPYKQKNPTQQEAMPSDKVLYNSGVICFKRGEPLMHDWAVASVCREKWYFGDQDILNALIYEQKTKVTSLPNTYNWIVKEWGSNPNAKVVHYAGLGRWYDHDSFSKFKIRLPKKPYHW